MILFDPFDPGKGNKQLKQLYLTHFVPPDISIAIVSITETDNCRLISLFISIVDEVDNHFGDYNIYRGLDAIVAQLHRTNSFLQLHKPWEVKKQPEQSHWLNCILSVTIETLRVCGILLQPITPTLCDKLLSRISVPVTERMWHHSKETFSSTQTKSLGENTGQLLPRLKAS